MSIIKRYANRKLYDLDARRYVTLDDIAKMIHSGQELRVIDHETEDDITSVVQAQIIFKEERQIKGGLPTAVLTNLIQAGSKKLQLVHDALIAGDGDAHVDAEIERRVRVLIERGALKKAAGQRLLDKLLALGEPAGARGGGGRELNHALNRIGLVSLSDVKALERQVEELTEKLARLNTRESKRTK